MSSRCQKCGIEIAIGDFCNHCLVVREEKDFLKMVNREEIDRISNTDFADHPTTAD